MLKEGRKKTFIIIYLMSFQSTIEYCVDIRAVKMFDVKNALKSSVKVFNYDDKSTFEIKVFSTHTKTYAKPILSTGVACILVSVLKSLIEIE